MNLFQLLKCPMCRQRGTLGAHSSDSVACSQCAASFRVKDGVLDFVGGRENTALDVNAYDEEKHVSLSRSQTTFNQLKRRAGENLPVHFGDVLEIGAGTGLLTLGMLGGAAFDRAIITDISPEMIWVCRGRAKEIVDLRKVLFATYSGKEDIFAQESFDLCVGNSVLHHILDYRTFLADVHRLTKPEGRAVFVEPSGEFHRAMTDAMSDALMLLLGQQALGVQPALQVLSAWTSETRAGYLFPEEARPQVEDKHIFFRDAIDEAAQAAGFRTAICTAWDNDALGLGALNNYCMGLGLSPEFREVFFPAYKRYAEVHFKALGPDEMSSMYVIILHN